ncbi:type I-F CRISPR-associated endoribonuclease Cas6/Csy4 [Moraxella sp. Tifton1]|uniref:Type I-F CRISPR-associated endoribonuclease Cas6/Csy4 n=1 Tax=Moraxella oculi TaxID=2940516 RepID=A0ABW8U3U6_9GAMM|nr:type I-F CRISPR-associated endoribonuclease Cas6/Csy4 [Moraxella sp. Tifton1]MCL1622992.1 type I-F CRISPR-associated endoribonuclease Cas6/Csy4 [Moraxella sp. Tifton1]
MNFYQEITLIPNIEITPYFIWGTLYKQLHIALADIKNKHGVDTIGVSFPEYQYEQKNDKTFAMLGNKLRIFAKTKDELEKLALGTWLSRLVDYLHLSSIKEVGDQATGHVVVKRYRHKSLHFYVKNYAKYHNISYEEALKACRNYRIEKPGFPFIDLTSNENGNRFKLAIQQIASDQEVNGSFNTYGINNPSGVVTVPHW